MSKFSSRGIRLKYTNKLCLKDRQGLELIDDNNNKVLIHKNIQDWIDYYPELIYHHVYKSVACRLQRLELSKKAVDYLHQKLGKDNPKIVFNIKYRRVKHSIKLRSHIDENK